MKNNLDVIVAFAKLWGITTADLREYKEAVNILEGYDSEELANLFTAWADEYMKNSEIEDLCDFFDEKMSEIIESARGYLVCPAGYENIEPKTINEVAKCIMEYGTKTNLSIYRANGEFLCNTYGIYLNNVEDMRFRAALLEVLTPMQKAVWAADPIKVVVYRPQGTAPMSAGDLADWANAVHCLAGGKGSPFTPNMFPNERLKGHHCLCGVTEDGLTKGTFRLLPLNNESVRKGGKAYMHCEKCGGVSHL